MNRISCCDWLQERARWSYLPRASSPSSPRRPWNENFTWATGCPSGDWSLKIKICMGYWPSLFGQDGWILASFFFCVFMDLDFVSVHKHAKKELGQYPAILTEQAWSITHTYFNFKASVTWRAAGCSCEIFVPWPPRRRMRRSSGKENRTSTLNFGGHKRKRSSAVNDASISSKD